MNLTRNNSFYLAGSIPITHVKYYIPTSDTKNSFYQYARERRNLQSEPLGQSVRDMSINALPQMCNENVSNAIDLQHSGVHEEDNHADPSESGTVIAWKSTSTPNISTDSIYLWSSYRIIDYHPYTGNASISMYSSLRGLYGTCITLTRSDHPSSLLPP